MQNTLQTTRQSCGIGASLTAGLMATLLLAGTAQAQQETARVVSSTPVIQQVAVTHDVCHEEAVTSAGNKSGAGALMGGVAGGAVGNAIGGGNGRAAATVLGVLGGAILGDKIEGPGQPQTQMVRRCYPQTSYENRTSGYHVVYEYAGKQYSVQMPNDPGPFIQLQITPVPAVPAYPAPAPAPARSWRGYP